MSNGGGKMYDVMRGKQLQRGAGMWDHIRTFSPALNVVLQVDVRETARGPLAQEELKVALGEPGFERSSKNPWAPHRTQKAFKYRDGFGLQDIYPYV